MSTLRELKGRISTVSSTAKITGAIKMISSAKMHKLEIRLNQLRPYHDIIDHTMSHLMTTDCTLSSSFMEERTVKRIALVVFGSDTGLCGAYNVNICKGLIKLLNELHSNNTEVDIYPVGIKFRRVLQSFKLKDINISNDFVVKAESDLTQISNLLTTLENSFITHKIDSVELFYMHYQSIAHQNLQIEKLLPVNLKNFTKAGKYNNSEPCILEPDPNEILDVILPMYVKSIMQDAFVENQTSAHAVRVLAMQMANDNASKLHDELQLEYNKIRQEGITKELLDIQGGQRE